MRCAHGNVPLWGCLNKPCCAALVCIQTHLRHFWSEGAEKGSGNIAVPFLYLRQDLGAANHVTEHNCNAK